MSQPLNVGMIRKAIEGLADNIPLILRMVDCPSDELNVQLEDVRPSIDHGRLEVMVSICTDDELAALDKGFIIGVCENDSTHYWTDRDTIEEALKLPLDERLSYLVKNSEPTTISMDTQIDFALTGAESDWEDIKEAIELED